jgi:outer membrane receptor protein involved in Fe transport
MKTSSTTRCSNCLGIYFLLFLVLIYTISFADTSGKLTGRITDKKSGEALIGVNIVVQGTSIGTATDFDGYFVIINVPPNIYSIRISSVGYESKIVQGVAINSGQSTTLNEKLSEQVIEGQEVVVVAEKPIVDTRQTSAVAIMNKDQIAVLPVQNLQDIVNLQAGVVDGHFRGGRKGEVQYQVDGVTVNNPLTNESVVSLDRSVLQEVQVISGTFDAEYGQAMSGVVNAVLRSGKNDAIDWSAEMYVGDYVGFGKNSKYPYLDDIDPLAIQSYQLSLSGPTGLPKTTFLLSGRRYASQGFYFGQRIFNPTDNSDFSAKIINPTGDKKLIPLSTNDEWSGQMKVSNSSFEGIQVSYQALLSLTNNKPYNFNYRYNPDGVKTPRSFSLVHGIDFTQMLSPKVFYTVNLRQNKIDYRDYKYEDIYDPRYYQAKQARSGGEDIYDGAIIQGLDLGRYMEKTTVNIVKASVTAQVTNIHLVKIGAELQLSDITYGNPGVIYLDTNGLTPYVNSPLFPAPQNYKPISFSAYVQDRIEWKEVSVRGGVRLEYFDAQSKVPSDPQNPANTIIGAPTSTSKNTTSKVVVAPRLGVSYPIMVNGSIYFSYGHFYQLPAINQFFSNSDYSKLKDLAGGSTSYGVIGNPDLKPEFTTQYEFGMKAQLNDFFGFDGSLFYKDIRNLLGVEIIETYNSSRYTRLTNVDFGSVSGFTLALDYRASSSLSASLDYSNQFALGNSSEPSETATRAAAGKDANPREIPFNWDQRHTVNGQVTFQEQNNYSLTAIAKFASGQPYTPSIGTGFGADLEDNSGRKPSGVTVDFRGEKQLDLYGIAMSAFIRVFNVFNTSFFNGEVFSATGSPDYVSSPTSADRVRLMDPNRYFAPRKIEIGISVHGSSLID